MTSGKGLGKGLSALFGEEMEKEQVRGIPILEIEPNPDQPRREFDPESMAELEDSIRRNGVITPISVRKAEKGCTIIAGERRWRAAKKAGLKKIPAIVLDIDEQKAYQLSMVENLQREDLNPIEEAEGCQQLIEKYGLTQESAAKRLGKSRSALANTLRLLALPDPVREQVRTGKLTAGHAKALLGLSDAAVIEAAAQQIEARGMNVRQAEALCRKLNKPPRPPKAEDAFTRPKIAVELEAALKDVTGSEVRIQYKEGRGTLQIDFYSDAQLSRFAELLGQYDPESADGQ